MKRHFEKTEAWRLTLGTTPGYALEGQKELPEADFARLYLDAAQAVYEACGVYPTAVMHRVRMLYAPEWGCPPEGEFGYELRGVRNPQFAQREPFLRALEALTETLKARLGQAAVHLEVFETDLEYYTDDELEASEHIFLLPFSYENESSGKQDADAYVRLLVQEKEWCDAWESNDRAVTYARWEYLSNEARGIFPDLALDPLQQERGFCAVLHWPLEKAQENAYTLIRDKTWTLEVRNLELHVYRHGVAILVLHTVNHTYPDLADILKLADYGRRLRQPYYPGRGEYGLSADTVTLTLNGEPYTSELFRQVEQTVQDETAPAPTPHFFRDLVAVPGVRVTPVADDRMFELELVYDETLSAQIKGANGPWRENAALEQQLYSLVFCDNKDPTCQDALMRRELLQTSIDPRWADQGTLYAATEYSFLCVTGADWFPRNVVGPNFLNQYLYMASLVLAQRTGLIRFAERAGDLDYRARKGKFIKRLNDLSADFSKFQMRMLISRFSDQDQGIELYEMLQRQLRVEPYRNKIQSQLRGVFEAASLEAQERQNRRIAWVSALLTLIGIGLTVLQILLH